MRWSEAGDAALLSASRSHPDAFMAFYERYEEPVIGYLLRRTRDAELAVDLASETFAAALAAAHRYRPSSETAAAWLFTIAHNVLVDSVRRGRVEVRARRRLGIREAVAYTDEQLEQIEARAGHAVSLEALLDKLPAGQRAAIEAHVLDERSYSEIASELKTSELVVRKRVSRGLATLRQQMKEAT